MRSVRGIALLVCLLALYLMAGIFHCARAADGVLILHDKSEHYILNTALTYLEDPTGRLDINDIIGGVGDGVVKRIPPTAFVRTKANVPNFSFTRSAYWFRVQLHNTNANRAEWVVESQYPLLDYLDAYLVYPDHRIVSYQSGDMQPFSQRSIKHRNVMFALHLEQGQSVTLYLRAATNGSLQLPLALWSEPALLAKDHEEQFVLGMYYGILLALFFYNLMIYLSTRDVSYLHYLHYLGGYLLFQMTSNGLAFEYLWPHYPWWGNVAMPFFLCVTFVGVLQFTRSFLLLESHFPKLDFLCRMLSWVYWVMMGLTLIAPYHLVIQIVAVGGIGMPLLVLVSGFCSLRRQRRQAICFLVAWSVLLVGAVLFTMTAIDLLPNMFITDYGVQVGSAIEVILLSFALANRMQILKEENEHILQHAAEMLEENVHNRTLKLEQANLDLASALTSLENMQDELIRAEKMAALGSLVGGIAHELNTPIGNSITMGSSLLGENQEILSAMQAGTLRITDAEQHLQDTGEGILVLMRNLQRAAELVSSFKQVAVDRATNQSRRFDLSFALEEIVLTLGPMFRSTPFRLELDLTADIAIESYPGPLGQIITNFISNALAHAFDGRTEGCMRLTTRMYDATHVEICFSDDGNGMEEAHLKRVFEPFFTTKLGQGGSGLGMHIVYNLVTGVLGGKIRVDSQVGKGTTLWLILPCTMADHAVPG